MNASRNSSCHLGRCLVLQAGSSCGDLLGGHCVFDEAVLFIHYGVHVARGQRQCSTKHVDGNWAGRGREPEIPCTRARFAQQARV